MKPPSAGDCLAKPGKAEYRRNLPHLQVEGKTIFLTFCTRDHWILPESVRERVLHHCLHDHGTKIHDHGVVVMPDHVHMVFTPLWDDKGYPYALAEITNGIKGASAHSINRILKRKGPVWQDESFDRVLRCNEAIKAKVEYICANPVRKGLCRNVDEYPWLWREWTEGVAQPPPAGYCLRITPEGGGATRCNPARTKDDVDNTAGTCSPAALGWVAIDRGAGPVAALVSTMCGT